MRILVCVAALSLLAASLAGVPAGADTYKRDNLTFDIPDMSVDEVEDAVISSLTFFGKSQSGDDPAMVHWETSPCYRAGSADPANRDTLATVLQSMGSRVSLEIPACADPNAPAITYYFAKGSLEPADRAAAVAYVGTSSKLFATFLDGSLPCYWKGKGPEVPEPLIGSAIVLVNSADLDAEGVRRCLFIGTVESLGVLRAAGLKDKDPDALRESAAAWKRNAELNLLSVYVLSQALKEIDPKTATASVAAATIRRLVESMHRNGE